MREEKNISHKASIVNISIEPSKEQSMIYLIDQNANKPDTFEMNRQESLHFGQSFFIKQPSLKPQELQQLYPTNTMTSNQSTLIKFMQSEIVSDQ